MPRGLTDEEVAALEDKSQPRGLTDQEVSQMESAAPAPAAPEVSKVESALRGFGQGGTFGFGDEIVGAAKAAGELWDGRTDLKGLLDTYRNYRDAERRQNAEAEAANPKTFTGSNVAGNVVTSFLPGVGMADKATKLGRIGTAFGQGAAYGVGASEADTVGGIAKDSATGALISGATAGALENLPAAGKFLRNRAEKLAEAATGATRRGAQFFKPNTGRALLDEGVVRFGSSPADIAKAATSKIEGAGKTIGSTLESVNQSVDQATVLKALDKAAQKFATDPANAHVGAGISKIAEPFKSEFAPQSYSLPELYQQGVGLAKRTKYGPMGGDYHPDALKTAASTIKELATDTATAANPAAGETLSNAKSVFGTMKPVQKAASERALQLQQSPLGGLLDVTSAAGGLGLSSLMDDQKDAWKYGLAVPLLRRGIIPRVNASRAVLSEGVGKLLQGAASAPTTAIGTGVSKTFLDKYLSPKEAQEEYVRTK